MESLEAAGAWGTEDEDFEEEGAEDLEDGVDAEDDFAGADFSEARVLRVRSASRSQ